MACLADPWAYEYFNTDTNPGQSTASTHDPVCAMGTLGGNQRCKTKGGGTATSMFCYSCNTWKKSGRMKTCIKCLDGAGSL